VIKNKIIMKKIKNKIAALVCGLVLLCGVTYTASAALSLTVSACGKSYTTIISDKDLQILTLGDIIDYGFGIADLLCSGLL
jgi:hypothetical protein